MTSGPPGSRTLAYHILRCCERLSLQETDFWTLPPEDQDRLLGYELLRQAEERSEGTGI